MGLQFRKAKMALNFREGKPEVFKLRQIVFPAVTTDQLVAECANSCGVNPSQTKAVIDALVNRIVHYMAIGHGVKMGEFGSFKPTFTSKTVKALNELEGDDALKTIKVKKIQFHPGKAFTQMLDSLSVTSAGEALDVKE